MRWLRIILLMSRPPLLCEEGNVPAHRDRSIAAHLKDDEKPRSLFEVRGADRSVPERRLQIENRADWSVHPAQEQKDSTESPWRSQCAGARPRIMPVHALRRTCRRNKEAVRQIHSRALI